MLAAFHTALGKRALATDLPTMAEVKHGAGKACTLRDVQTESRRHRSGRKSAQRLSAALAADRGKRLPHLLRILISLTSEERRARPRMS
jgi:hypothetical protein